MHVLIAGATGMVGGTALRHLLASPDVTHVTALGRRPCGLAGPVVSDVLCPDLADLSAVQEAFDRVDAALFCVGVYTGSVPDDVLRTITVDHAIRFGEALRAHSPKAALCFLSGQGADPSGKSRASFSRYKGAAENALRSLGLARVHVFRPGYIYPSEPRTEPNVGYRAMRVLYPTIKAVWPNFGVSSDDLGRAMAHAAIHGLPGRPVVLENADIRAVAAAEAPAPRASGVT